SWDGPNVTGLVPTVLQAGTPELTVTAPSALAGTYLVGTASFGPPLTAVGLNGEVMPVVDQVDGTGLACAALNAANATAGNAKIALVDRGVCSFHIKAED